MQAAWGILAPEYSVLRLPQLHDMPAERSLRPHAPDVRLIQPGQHPAAGISQSLDGGAMRPPGVQDGGVSGGPGAKRMDQGR